ncbi:hypothetical protein OE88DRAFT_1777233 [Heliocybe sulcata]|uniref:Uncharacterized protein n=1 Tax=Heliocybe sulcata TaxID=5364 RepID=A0A5C3MNK0_9AGAM|nr:hypothetical protein OE88DRAFT_1777233 [Heliocybe sulcata]
MVTVFSDEKMGLAPSGRINARCVRDQSASVVSHEFSSDSRKENYSLEPIQTGGGLGLGELIDEPARTDEFGVSSGPSTSQTVSNSSASAYALSSSSGGRQEEHFATFPIKRRRTGNGESAGANAKEAEARRSEDSPSIEGLPAYTHLDLSLGGGLQAEPLSLTPASTGNGNQNQNHRTEEDNDDDHVELAYMPPTAESPLPSPMHSRFAAVSAGSNGGTWTDGGLGVARGDSRLTFKSEATNIEEAMERRSEEACREPGEPLTSKGQRKRLGVCHPQQAMERIPTPPSDAETDERSLNAAAAREVGRELDALLFSPPAHAPASARPMGLSAENDSSNIDSRLEVGEDQYGAHTPSPLVPPAPPFASNSPGVGQTSYAQAWRASVASQERKESPPLLPRMLLQLTLSIGGRSFGGCGRGQSARSTTSRGSDRWTRAVCGGEVEREEEGEDEVDE